MSQAPIGKLPSLDKEGRLRPFIKSREASLAGADGVVGSGHRLIRTLNEPPRPRLSKERGNLLDGAATPPYPRRGVCLPQVDCTLSSTVILDVVIFYGEVRSLKRKN